MNTYQDNNKNIIVFETKDVKSNNEYKITCDINKNMIKIMRKHVSSMRDQQVVDLSNITTIDITNYALYYDMSFLYPTITIPIEDIKKNVTKELGQLFALSLEENDIATLAIIKDFEEVSPRMQDSIIRTLRTIINEESFVYKDIDDYMEKEIVKALEYAELSRKA